MLINTSFTAVFTLIAFGVTLGFIHAVASPIAPNSLNVNSHEDTDEILFEGDIKISKHIVIDKYNFSSIPGGEEFLKELEGNASTEIPSSHQKRAAVREIGLWPNGVVRYRISRAISQSTARRIRNAMDHWEDHTCLRFSQVPASGDYIEFVNSFEGCYSNSIGMKGGRQVINLEANTFCESVGVIIHEIGHAVGFWHEQSRPDRDDYVTINFDNIREEKKTQFMKRTDSEVNSLGSTYDYGSIMHYADTDSLISGCVSDCKTITVNNELEYNRQGRPRLGQLIGLSTEDVNQANILYVCPGIGEHGFLMFHARFGHSLNNSADGWLNNPDPYIKFTAVSSSGIHYYRYTSTKSGTTNPHWNEWVSLCEGDWYFFRIQVYDSDSLSSHDDMTLSETFTVERGHHYSVKHCEDTACKGYVIFDYRLSTVLKGDLQVNIRYARNLPDTDGILNNPDPYVTVSALSAAGSTTALCTRDISGTRDPTWNQQLSFGCRSYAGFEIQIWDSDYNADDEMSNKEFITIVSGSHTYQRHNAHSGGYLIYDYHFILDGNDCSPNPCQNRGTCIDQCLSYRCNCRSGYTGTNCEHRTGRLSVYARYARNLPDEDGWLNDSDPYMEFIAVDQDGNLATLTTSTRRGTHNPDWYQNLHFGTRSWRYLRVKVWDDDNNADDALSNQQTITLSNPGVSQNFFTHYCHRGHAVFDYTYN